MTRLRTVLATTLSTPDTDARVGAAVSFLGALTVFLVGLQKAAERSQSPYELLVATGVVLNLSVMLVLLGFMAGRTRGVPASPPA